MTDITIHFRGTGDEQRSFPALPRTGDYLDTEGALWMVDRVVFGATVDVYANRLSDSLAAELRGEWGRWVEVADSAEQASQQELFTQ